MVWVNIVLNSNCFQTQAMFETESESLKLLDRLGLFRIPESFVVSISKIRF